MRIFLSYRRADVGGHAGRLSDRLEQRLGAKNVFQDVTNIAAGRDFAAAIRNALDRCDVALAVIGPGWLSASTSDGNQRLFEPDDYVRLELASVLSRDLPVAPVLVGGATLPAAADLPEELRPLMQRQAIVLRDETWHQDVENLLRSLRGERQTAPGASRRRIGLAVGASLLAITATVAWWQPWAAPGGPKAGPSGDGTFTSIAPASASCPNPNGEGWTKIPISQNASAQLPFDGGVVTYTGRSAAWRMLEPGRWQVVVDTRVANQSTSGTFDHGPYRYWSMIVGKEFPLACFETSEGNVPPGALGDGRTGYIVSCEPSGRVDLAVGDSGTTRLPLTDAAEPSPC